MQDVPSLTLVVALTVLGVGVAGANTPPLAEAGLDQQVEQNTTVHLDAGGSVDPDGNLTGYEWSVEAPDGTSLRPDCRTCPRTQFVPDQVGQYNVSVIVTDDNGATSEDTMYVDVERAYPPRLNLTGPASVAAGSNRSYHADVTAGDAALSSLTWRVDGGYHDRGAVDGDAATETEAFSFPPGEHNLTVTVVDDDGKRATDTLTIQAVDTSATGALDLEGTGGGGGGGTEELVTFNVDSRTWDVNTELAARMDATVEVGDAEVSTEQLESIQNSDTVVNSFENAGTTERQMVKAAGQRKNNYEATGEGSLDTVDNTRGQVSWTGLVPNSGSTTTHTSRSSGSSAGSSGNGDSGDSGGVNVGSTPGTGSDSSGGGVGGGGGTGGIGAGVP